MIRDTLTVAIVSLSLIGTAPLQDGDSLGVQILAATGDARRSLSRFLDAWGDIKAGGTTGTAGVKAGGAPELVAEAF